MVAAWREGYTSNVVNADNIDRPNDQRQKKKVGQSIVCVLKRFRPGNGGSDETTNANRDTGRSTNINAHASEE